jgi:hypothetical protein
MLQDIYVSAKPFAEVAKDDGFESTEDAGVAMAVYSTQAMDLLSTRLIVSVSSATIDGIYTNTTIEHRDCAPRHGEIQRRVRIDQHG